MEDQLSRLTGMQRIAVRVGLSCNERHGREEGSCRESHRAWREVGEKGEEAVRLLQAPLSP